MLFTKQVYQKNDLKKDGNGMDLTEVEDIRKRWQEYTEELYKKVVNQITMKE